MLARRALEQVLSGALVAAAREGDDATPAAWREQMELLADTARASWRGLLDDVVRRVRASGWTVDQVDTEAAGDARRLAEACDAARYAVIDAIATWRRASGGDPAALTALDSFTTTAR